MKSKPLTDAKCRNAKFDEAGGNKLFDGGGLFLDLRPSGSKKWRLKYRFNGKENLLTFGDYPATSLADARSRRDEAKRLLGEGKNPAFERDVEKQTRAIAAQNTFEAVALEWYEAQQATWSASHANRVKKQLDREVFPLIGQRPISSIGAPDLLAVIRRIEGREAFETARKTLQICGQVFRYAVATSRAERDPSPDLRGALKAVPVKHMARVSESELPELLRSIAAYEGEPETRLALRFLALTFVRTIELRQAEWTEIDLERREWRIPGREDEDASCAYSAAPLSQAASSKRASSIWPIGVSAGRAATAFTRTCVSSTSRFSTSTANAGLDGSTLSGARAMRSSIENSCGLSMVLVS